MLVLRGELGLGAMAGCRRMGCWVAGKLGLGLLVTWKLGLGLLGCRVGLVIRCPMVGAGVTIVMVRPGVSRMYVERTIALIGHIVSGWGSWLLGLGGIGLGEVIVAGLGRVGVERAGIRGGCWVPGAIVGTGMLGRGCWVAGAGHGCWAAGSLGLGLESHCWAAALLC